MHPTPQQLGKYTIHVRALFNRERSQNIILIHGLGVSGDYYIPYATALSANANVYILDLPGYGNTPKPSSALTIKKLASLVNAFVKQNNLENSVIIGQSMGCQIVAHAILLSAKSYQKAILIGPTSNKDERTLAFHSWRLIQDTFREPLKANIIVIKNYIQMGLRRYFITAQFMLSDHIETHLPEIPIPILFIRGVHDPIVPTNWLSHLQSITPNASMVEIADAAHLVHYKKAATLADITKEFIAS